MATRPPCALSGAQATGQAVLLAVADGMTIQARARFSREALEAVAAHALAALPAS